VALQLVLLTFYNQEQNMRLTRPELRKIMAAGLLMPLASLPLLAFFFPVLPRTQIPLWHFLPATTARTSGFSDAVEPGASSSLGSSRQLVLRAEMPRLPQQQLYWRGTVFNLIDGRRWVRTAPAVERSSTIGTRIRQTIYPEPGSSRFLIALDAPAVLDLQRSRRLTDCLYEFTGAPGKRFTYTADSVPSGRLVSNGSINRSFYLTLPLQLPQRIRQLADSIRTAGDSDLGRVERLENYFRNGSFRYSRSGLSTGEDAIEKFLFENRQGHCEFFASSFAMVLRAAGVPTRLVGGFLGGEYNQLGGYYLVTDDMAHVWVEVFIDGQGWLRIDPSRFASNADTVWSPSKKSMLLQIRMAMDSLDHAWNRTVITYDFERQLTVARSVGTRLQGFESGKIAKTVIPYLAGMAVLAVIIAVLMYRKTLFPLRETRLLHAFYRTVERDCAVQVDRGREGVFEVAARTGNSRVREFADIYAGVVYRDRRLNGQEYLRLKTILKEGFRHVA
jgi:transglutaminase-like putative cysteine protease